MSLKCAHCEKEINPDGYVWVYDDEEVIHQDCFDDWAFDKLSGQLKDMSGASAICKFR